MRMSAIVRLDFVTRWDFKTKLPRPLLKLQIQIRQKESCDHQESILIRLSGSYSGW